MNRYQPSSLVEAWISYEWLLAEKLREIDHMTRQMYRDMQLAGARKSDIETYLPEQFARLWERVALETAQAKE